MVSVQVRNTGDGLWSRLSLPISVQVAQTLAGAARQLNIADEIRIQPAEAFKGRAVDVRV